MAEANTNPAAATAALPWAAAGADVKPVQDNRGAEAVSEEDLQPASMQQLGLQPGTADRIEVLWEVQPDEGEASSRWFAATISCSSSASAQAPSAPAQDQPTQPTSAPAPPAATAAAAADPPSTSCAPSKQPHQQFCCTLKYDGSEDFPEETATVLLLTEHELWECERRDVMVWRREGDAYEPAEDDSEAEEYEEEEGGLVSATNMELSPEEAAEAEAAEAQLMDRLTSMTQTQAQRADLVAGYNDFKEQFKAFIAAKASCSDGANVVITAADVEEFKAIMNTQRATARAHRR